VSDKCIYYSIRKKKINNLCYKVKPNMLMLMLHQESEMEPAKVLAEVPSSSGQLQTERRRKFK
jgi:hypothetical protein